MFSKKIFKIIIATIFFLSITGCINGDKIQKTILVLDDAIHALDQNSNEWQSVLEDAQSKLTEDFQSSVKNEINNLLIRGIAVASGEMRCDTDFIGNRIRYSLVRIKSSLTGDELPLLPPNLCNVIPLAIEKELVPRRLNKVEFYGYDLDSDDLTIHLQNGGNLLDITNYLSRPTHYHMTLNLGGNGVILSSNSSQFIIKWGNEVVSTISIIQPSTPVCKVKDIQLDPGEINYIPPHKSGGDKDFDGNGPNVTGSVSLMIGRNKITAYIYIEARETEDNWTTASGSMDKTIYTAPDGWKIDHLENSAYDSVSYVDFNHEDDIFLRGFDGPVNRFIFTGDTDGDESGTRTKIQVKFNELRIRLKQSGNCVTRHSLVEANKVIPLSAEILRKIRQVAPVRRLPDRDP